MRGNIFASFLQNYYNPLIFTISTAVRYPILVENPLRRG